MNLCCFHEDDLEESVVNLQSSLNNLLKHNSEFKCSLNITYFKLFVIHLKQYSNNNIGRYRSLVLQGETEIITDREYLNRNNDQQNEV